VANDRRDVKTGEKKKKNAEHCNSVRPSSRCHSLSKGFGQVRAPERRGGLQVKVKVNRISEESKSREDAPLGGWAWWRAEVGH
jgi:hypothetical protein